MSSDDPAKEMRQLHSEIAHLNARILKHVYRSAWSREQLESLSDELAARKRRLTALLQQTDLRSQIVADTPID